MQRAAITGTCEGSSKLPEVREILEVYYMINMCFGEITGIRILVKLAFQKALPG